MFAVSASASRAHVRVSTKPGQFHFFRRVPGKKTHQIGICFSASCLAGELSSLSRFFCGVSDFSKNQPAILGLDSVPNIGWKMLPEKCPSVGFRCRIPCLVQFV